MHSDFKRKVLGLRIIVLVFLATSAWPVPAEPRLSSFQINRPALMVDKYSSQYDDLFRYYSNRHFGPFVDWRWFKAQAVAESRLEATARSERGASGVMQLLPGTFLELRKGHPYPGDIHDPRVNISAGMMYNRTLYRKWSRIFNGGDRLLFMLASYNAGFYRVYASYRTIRQVRQWDDIKQALPGETRAYLRRIRELMQPLEAPVELMVASAEPRAGQLSPSSLDSPP